MQYFQKHAFWDITRQNRCSGLTPSCANEQTKKAQTINISPLRGGHAPEPIDMPFGVLSGLPDVITLAKFCVNRLRGFSAAAPRKVPFPILFWTTLTTVLHYRADCDLHGFSGPLGLKWVFLGVGGKIGEEVVRYWPPLRISSYFAGFLCLCQFWWKSIKKCDRESARRLTDTQTDRHTDAYRFYNLSHAICYSYRTDNYMTTIESKLL